MELLEKIFDTAPPFIQLVLVVLIVWVYLDKNGIPHSKKAQSDNCSDFVKRDECHSHIDGLKNDIKIRFDETNREIHDVKESVNTIINAMIHKGQ